MSTFKENGAGEGQRVVANQLFSASQVFWNTMSTGVVLAIAFPAWLHVHAQTPRVYSWNAHWGSVSFGHSLMENEDVRPSTHVSQSPVLAASRSIDPSSGLSTVPPGALRVSNQTYHPVRIALLPQLHADQDTIAQEMQELEIQEPEIQEIVDAGFTYPDPQTDRTSQQLASSSQTDTDLALPLHGGTNRDEQAVRSPSPQYGTPIHWDFVPREGHDHGFLLAVSDGHIQLQPGDILTAFAQDGSRQYWGPYVVGVTDLPVWNPDTQEWSLVLETPFPW